MERLFEALRERYPGMSVVDVRFTALNHATNVCDPAQMDRELAEAIRTAEEQDIKEICT